MWYKICLQSPIKSTIGHLVLQQTCVCMQSVKIKTVQAESESKENCRLQIAFMAEMEIME